MPPPVQDRVLVTHDERSLYVAFARTTPSREDPRPPARPRQRLQRRLRRRRDRHLQRPAARLRVLRQPARRADGPDPERRDRQRGRLLGRDLGLGRPGHRRRLRRRDGDPVPRSGSRAHGRRPRLGHRRAAFLAARPSPPHRLEHALRARPQLLPLPGVDKLTGFRASSPAATSSSTRRSPRTDKRAGRDDAARAVASDRQVDPGITGAGASRPNLTLNARSTPTSRRSRPTSRSSRQQPVRALLPEKRPFFLEGADFFATRLQAVFTPQRRRPRLGLKVTGKEGGTPSGCSVGTDRRNNLLFPVEPVLRLRLLDEANTRRSALPPRPAGSGSAIGAACHRPRGDGYHNRVLGLDSLYRWGEGRPPHRDLRLRHRRTAAARRRTSGTGQRLRGACHACASLTASVARQHASPRYQRHQRRVPRRPRLHPASRLPQGLRHPLAIPGTPTTASTGGTRWSLGRREHLDLRHSTATRCSGRWRPTSGSTGPRQSYGTVYLGLGDSFYVNRSFDRNFVSFFGDVAVGLALSNTMSQARRPPRIAIASVKGAICAMRMKTPLNGRPVCKIGMADLL